jgi:hypothetical protein
MLFMPIISSSTRQCIDWIPVRKLQQPLDKTIRERLETYSIVKEQCFKDGYPSVWSNSGVDLRDYPWLSTHSKKAASSISTRRPARFITRSKPLVFAWKMRWRRPPWGGHSWCSFHLGTGIRRRCILSG